jgi:hypothetical protein
VVKIDFYAQKYLLSFFLILLLASLQLPFAQEFQEPKSCAVLVKEAIANLDSNDIEVAAQAAIHPGGYRATEAVPKLLQVLQSSRLLLKTEHVDLFIWWTPYSVFRLCSVTPNSSTNGFESTAGEMRFQVGIPLGRESHHLQETVCNPPS